MRAVPNISISARLLSTNLIIFGTICDKKPDYLPYWHEYTCMRKPARSHEPSEVHYASF